MWGNSSGKDAKVIKTVGANGKASVRFSLDPRVGATRASVCGEWNGWAKDVDAMDPDAAGGFSLVVDLEPGRAYRFRYLLDDSRWENDWDADAYVPNNFGGDDSLVDLTRIVDGPIPPAPAGTVKKAARARKAAPAQKAAPTKAPAKGPAKKTPKKTGP
jgi:hypothetical protein